MLVGATDWCDHPRDLDVVRVGGTKNPGIDTIVRLAPDLVIANEEENREPDLTALREAGVEVLVTEVRRGRGPGCRGRWRRGRRPTVVRPPWCPSGAGPGWSSAGTPSPAT